MLITLDEGYQFGLGVFETIHVREGIPLLLDWHLERLCRSMKELNIEQPPVEKSQVLSWLSSRPASDHALKIMASGENTLFTLRPNPYTPEKIQAGFRLSYSDVYRNETSPLVRHKTLNYGDCILEKRRAKKSGEDERIFCNSRGEICEGTATNIFFAHSGKIYTPPISCGLLPGILRRFILEHFSVTETPLRKEDDRKMDECFVTNSLMGIMPVRTLDEKHYFKGPVTAACMKSYNSYISSCMVF